MRVRHRAVTKNVPIDFICQAGSEQSELNRAWSRVPVPKPTRAFASPTLTFVRMNSVTANPINVGSGYVFQCPTTSKAPKKHGKSMQIILHHIAAHKTSLSKCYHVTTIHTSTTPTCRLIGRLVGGPCWTPKTANLRRLCQAMRGQPTNCSSPYP